MIRLPALVMASLTLAIALVTPFDVASARKKVAPTANDAMPPEADPMAAGMMDLYRPIEVSRMTDSELSCEQLFAESGHLDRQLAAMPKPVDPMLASQKMQDDMRKKMQGQQRKAKAGGIASSLLSLVPGVGGIAGGLAASAMRPNMADMTPDTGAFMADMQKSAMQGRARAEHEARKAHVTDLFLDRSCKVSTLDQAAVQAATRVLDGSSETAIAAPRIAAPNEAPADAAAAAPVAPVAPVAADP